MISSAYTCTYAGFYVNLIILWLKKNEFPYNLRHVLIILKSETLWGNE